LFANCKWTGPADPAIRAAAHVRALGADVTFAQAGFVHSGGEHRVAEELWNWRLPVVTGLQLRKHFHARSLRADVLALRDLVKRDGYRILHCHLDADHLLAALACRRLAEPPAIVRTLYDPDPPRRGLRARYCFARTAAVLAPTKAVVTGLVRRFALQPESVVLEEPVTEPRAAAGADLRASWGLGPGHRLVGITARIQPHRRFDLLWQVAARVVAAVPESRFVLLGRGNEQDTAALVREPIARLGLQDKVLLPGYLREPDYSAALRSLDVFLFLVPGSDGTCRAVREAMATGRPVVATRRGILPELLAERRAGECPGSVCPEEPLELAREIVGLLRNDDQRARWGAAGRRRALLDMDPVAAARRLAQLYEQLAGSAAAGGPA
jgi:glycosyltransferase involved in cell wall biosynthesis